MIELSHLLPMLAIMLLAQFWSKRMPLDGPIQSLTTQSHYNLPNETTKSMIRAFSYYIRITALPSLPPREPSRDEDLFGPHKSQVLHHKAVPDSASGPLVPLFGHFFLQDHP